MESKTCLVQLLEKMLEKCPASYSLVRHLSCLNPVEMAPNKDACSAKFKKVLRLLVNSSFWFRKIANFQSVEDRVDIL